MDSLAFFLIPLRGYLLIYLFFFLTLEITYYYQILGHTLIYHLAQVKLNLDSLTKILNLNFVNKKKFN